MAAPVGPCLSQPPLLRAATVFARSPLFDRCFPPLSLTSPPTHTKQQPSGQHSGPPVQQDQRPRRRPRHRQAPAPQHARARARQPRLVRCLPAHRLCRLARVPGAQPRRAGWRAAARSGVWGGRAAGWVGVWGWGWGAAAAAASPGECAGGRLFGVRF